MPCGGIWPHGDIAAEGETPKTPYPCWACDTRGADHWLEEWDAFIHGTCVREFLKTKEGQIVVRHKHHIQIGDEVLQEEGQLNEALLVDPNPDGPGRCWRYNNSDYTWQVAKDLWSETIAKGVRAWKAVHGGNKDE